MRVLITLLWLLFIPFTLRANDYYVSNRGNDQTGTGSKEKPFETLAKALASIPADKNHTLHLDAGLFRIKQQLVVPSGVNLIGKGFEKTLIRCENYFDLQSTSRKGRDWQAGPVVDPQVTQTASLLFKGKNQLIKGLNFDGVTKQTIAPILIVYGENLVFDSIYAHDFLISGWWLHEGKNITLRQSKFVNNSSGNVNQDYGAVMFHRVDNLFIHDNLIDERDTHSYGIKMASKDQCEMWSCKDRWETGQVNDNVNIFNNVIKVNEVGSWSTPNNPATRVPAFTIEFNSTIECRAKIYHNQLNNAISLVSWEMGQATQYEVYNNLVDLRQPDGNPKRYAYFLEANEEHLNIHHNLVLGGYYPIASWDDRKKRNKDCRIHHNIFYGPTGGEDRLHFFPAGSGFDGYQFYNNTVIDVSQVGKLFSVRNPDRCNTNAFFKNNIFYAFQQRGDILGDSCAVNGDMANNLFYNIDPRGRNALSADPQFSFKGLLTETGYFALKPGSKAINAGVVIEPSANDVEGSAPDLGALESGKPPFAVGVQNFRGPGVERANKAYDTSKFRPISLYDYQDKVTGGWIAQAVGSLFGYYTEFRWKNDIMPFGFNDYTEFKYDLLVKIWDEQKTFDKVLREVDKYKNDRSNWVSWQPKSMLDQDELYLEFLFLHSIAKHGLQVTSRQMADDWVAYLNPNLVWGGNGEALQNFYKGIWPPASGQRSHNIQAGAIDFQIESELFGLISPGMRKPTLDWCATAGQLMSSAEGRDGGIAVAAMTSEAFFENDPRVLMQYGIAALPDTSAYAEMMKTILAGSKQYARWEDLWVSIQSRPWRVTPNARNSTLIEGAYSFIGLLYGNGGLLESMNIAMRCGADSDCNPSTVAGILGTIYGYSKLPDKWKSLRQLPVDNNALYEIYPKAISWDPIIDQTVDVGKWMIRQQGGYIDQDILYIPLKK